MTLVDAEGGVREIKRGPGFDLLIFGGGLFGAQLWRAGPPGGVRVELNGRQAAVLVVARVRMPVERGGRYRLRWRYSAEFTEGAAPLGWSMNGGEAAGEWRGQARGAEAEFEAGARDLVEAALVSRPGRGWSRPEGRLQLEWVRVRRVEKAQSVSGHL